MSGSHAGAQTRRHGGAVRERGVEGVEVLRNLVGDLALIEAGGVHGFAGEGPDLGGQELGGAEGFDEQRGLDAADRFAGNSGGGAAVDGDVDQHLERGGVGGVVRDEAEGVLRQFHGGGPARVGRDAAAAAGLDVVVAVLAAGGGHQRGLCERGGGPGRAWSRGSRPADPPRVSGRRPSQGLARACPSGAGNVNLAQIMHDLGPMSSQIRPYRAGLCKKNGPSLADERPESDPGMNLCMAESDQQAGTGDGWERQGVTIPKQVWAALRGLAGKRGHGSMKVITTGGMALIAGMPEPTRERLLRWIAITEWDHGPAAITPEAVWSQLLAVMREDLGNAEVIGRVERVPAPDVAASKLVETLKQPPMPSERTHEVTRILDPTLLGGAAKMKKKGGAA